MPQEDYTPAFVEENELKVTPPDLSDNEVRKALKKHPMWKEFDSRCISCGRCTHRCPEFISISATVNKMNAAVEEIKADMARKGV